MNDIKKEKIHGSMEKICANGAEKEKQPLTLILNVAHIANVGIVGI